MNTPQVMWSYVNLAGIRSDLTSTTDVYTGASTLRVYTTQPGYYSCEVSENGVSSRTFTVGVFNTSLYTGMSAYYAHYTVVTLI